MNINGRCYISKTDVAPNVMKTNKTKIKCLLPKVLIYLQNFHIYEIIYTECPKTLLPNKNPRY